MLRSRVCVYDRIAAVNICRETVIYDGGTPTETFQLTAEHGEKLFLSPGQALVLGAWLVKQVEEGSKNVA